MCALLITVLNLRIWYISRTALILYVNFIVTKALLLLARK